MDAVSVRSVEVSNVKGTILSCHLHAAAFADNIDRIASSFLFFFFSLHEFNRYIVMHDFDAAVFIRSQYRAVY